MEARRSKKGCHLPRVVSKFHMSKSLNSFKGVMVKGLGFRVI